MNDTSAHEATAVRAIFEELASRKIEPVPYGADGTYRFDLGAAGCWFVTVSVGTVTVTDCPTHAKCEVTCSADDFIKLAGGKLSPVSAFLQGRVSGSDVAMFMGFGRLLSSSP